MSTRPETSRSPRTMPILVASMALGAGIGLIFPRLAEFQDRYGFSTAGLGLISGASFLAALVSGLLLAGLADRGHTRLLLVGGLVLSAAGLLWFAVGTELWQFVGARLLEGLGAGVFFPAARKVVTSGDPLHAGRRLGTLTSAELGGFLLGPVIGAGLTQLIGLDAPFVAIGAVMVGLAAWLAVVGLPPLVIDDRPRSPLAGVLMLRRPAVSGAALLSVALFLPVGAYDALWSRYLTDRGASTLFIGVGLSLYAVPVILLAPWGGKVADRLGPVRAAAWALLVIVPTTSAYGILTVPVVITGVALVEGVAQAVANPSVQTAMLRACRTEEVAAGQGLANAVNQVGAAATALLAPVVYEVAGPATVFVGIGIVMAALFVGGLVLHRRGAVDDPVPVAPN
jgi:predicted MFS family arabinose efflux permease